MHIGIVREAAKAALPPLTVVTIRESSDRIAVGWTSVIGCKVSRNKAAGPARNKKRQPRHVHAALCSTRARITTGTQ